MYPFAFNKTHVSISTEGLSSYTSAPMGNFLNPAYATALVYAFHQPYSWIDRILNVICCIIDPILMDNAKVPVLKQVL